MDEALTGLKSALAVKIYGPDLNVLQSKALEIKRRLAQVPGFTELTVVRELGQPSLLIDVDRDKIARYGINVADVEGHGAGGGGRPGGHPGHPGREAVRPGGAHEAASSARTRSRSATCWWARPPASRFRSASLPTSTRPAARRSSIAKIIRATSACSTASKAAICRARCTTDSRRSPISRAVLPPGYRLDWGGEYSEFLEARHQMEIIGPLAVLIIFMILFALYGNFKFPVTIAARRGDRPSRWAR